MDVFAPKYYKNFKCIAGECKHNCCIGWEIDIDSESLEYYKTDSEIIKNICFGDTPHFILGEGERCPFLNKDNLCNIILKHGEQKLCQICKDHPRFVNEYNSREEIGLGLTCEAAVKLILDNDFSLEKVETDDISAMPDTDEEDFFEFRDGLFKKDVKELKPLLPKFTLDELFTLFSGFERLDSSWDTLLGTLKGKNQRLCDLKIKDSTLASRLFCYFLYRHLRDCGVEFCIFCTYFILSIEHDLYETARMFSSEIEYSDQNVDKILEAICG